MKSKQQKRDEAMLRARTVLPKHRQIWTDSQPGGVLYEKAKAHSQEYADQVQRQATMAFERAAAHAGTDLHGNPLNEKV